MSSFPTDRPWALEIGTPAAVVATVAGAALYFLGIVWAALGVVFVCLAISIPDRDAGIGRILSGRPASLALVWQSALGGVAMAVVLPPFTWLWRRLLSLMDIVSIDQEVAVNVVTSSGWKLVLLLVSSLLFAPVMEELIFRRLVYGLLLDKCGNITALAVSSALFSAVHCNIAAAPALLAVGAALLLWYRRKGNILAPMLMHSFYNAATAALLKMESVVSG